MAAQLYRHFMQNEGLIHITDNLKSLRICLFPHLGHMCEPPPSLHGRSTPVYRLQSGPHSTGRRSCRGGSHYSRAGRLSWSKEPLRSSCHPTPLRPVPTSGPDSRFHLQGQGQMKETARGRRRTSSQAVKTRSCGSVNTRRSETYWFQHEHSILHSTGGRGEPGAVSHCSTPD